jgi:hypothetical protein
MNAEAARSWLIKISLFITGANFAFFLIAPAIGYPLTFEQSMRLQEINLPVFLGYLGSAAHFIFRSSARTESNPSLRSNSLVALLVKGPVIIFGVATGSAIIAFGFTNRSGAQPGSGMSTDVLAAVLSAALGILAVTTSVAVSYLFSAERRN